jgi:omega-hydroxy-beta-dihydromenaquinone-9 sulfotransferase
VIQQKNVAAIRYLLAFAAVSSFRGGLRLMLVHRGRVDLSYLYRAVLAAIVSILTAPIRFPFRLYERVRYGSIIDTLEITNPPVFILGHWRSGTTYLHNLLSQDENMGYVSLFQTMANDVFLVGDKLIKPRLAMLLPGTRPMDNVSFSLDNPEEEEHTIVRAVPYSFYHQWFFPRKGRYFFEKYALFRDVSKVVVAEWQRTYLSILRKATLNTGGKRLVLKNPVNTARIKMLLDLFPEAKFVHIYRNPYHVFLSTRGLYQRTLALTQLQHISQDEIDGNILLFYQEMMQKYLQERQLIPPENLVEIRFEDLETNPLAELRQIYETLKLPGFDVAESTFCEYIARQASYKKNAHQLDDETIDQVNRHWQFMLQEGGYEQLAPISP